MNTPASAARSVRIDSRPAWDSFTSPNYPVLVTNAVAGQGPIARVTIEYELTREEVISMVRWHLVHVADIRSSMLSVVVVFLFGLVLVLHGGSGYVIAGGIWMGFWLSILVIGGVRYYQAPRLAWKHSAAVGPRVMEFTDEYIHVRTNNTDGTIRWNTYSKALEMPQMYMLRHGTRKNMYTYVPKRAFRSPSDERAFRSLAAAHIAIEHQGPFRKPKPI